MPTFKQYTEHIINSHGVDSNEFLRLLVAADGQPDSVHNDLHQTETSHEHNADGTVVNNSKTVLGDKNIIMTDDGWALDATAQEALQELNSIINTSKISLTINNEQRPDGKIQGLVQAGMVTVEVDGDNFVDVVRLLLGEGYNELEERNNNE